LGLIVELSFVAVLFDLTPEGGAQSAGTLRFATTSFNSFEVDTNATVLVIRVGGAAGTVTVDFATSNGTATAGLDYVATNGTLTFAPGRTNSYFFITLLPDALTEGGETANLTLSNPTGGALLSDGNAVLSIFDHPIPLRFATNYFSGLEGTTNALITVLREGDADSKVTVDFATTDGTASAGVDYVATNGTLTFYPGQTNSSFPITLLPDALTEGDETVYLSLSNPAGGATLSQSAATLTILDVPPPPAGVGFSQSYYTVSESVGTAQVNVTRGGATNTAVTVHYETQDGSARAGLDYTAQSGTLTFGPGETLQTISIPILADDLPEGDEGFHLILGNPTGGATLDGSFAYIMIPNSEAFVQFSSATYTANEFAGSAIITVTRTPTESYPRVDYATSGGTATPGLDYLEQHGTLYFGDQTNATFTVPVLEDTVAEGTETVNLTLSNPFNVNLGVQKTAVLAILSASSGVEFVLAGGAVSENGGSANIVVGRRGDANVTFTVDYSTTTNGTAKAGLDYQPVSGTLTFAPGEKR